MYNFLFGFFYILAIKKNEIPRYTTSLLVSIALIFHILCLLALLKYFAFMDLPFKEHLTNKFNFLPFIIISIILVYLYFTPRRIKVILTRHIIFVILMYILPLSIIIFVAS